MMTPTDGQAAQTIGFFNDVAEIRECRVAEANQLLAEGWQLQGVYSWSQRVEPKRVEPKKEGEQGYVRRAVVYVLLRRRG
jgi:hypothetical protein